MAPVIVGSCDGIPDWDVLWPLSLELAAPGELKQAVTILMENVTSMMFDA